MGVYAITGCATGIGAAVRAGLEKEGHTVIGVDIKDAQIIADLTTDKGRQHAVAEIRKQAPSGLDGLIPCAGVGPQTKPWSLVISLNFFGAIMLTKELKDLLVKKRGVVVFISSNSASLPGLNQDLIAALLDEDEAKACAMIEKLDGHNAYAGGKCALTRWMRRQSSTWAPEGVRLNAVAPGATLTPLLQAGLDDPNYGNAIRNFPIPTGGFGTPEQIAAMILFLLQPNAAFCNGAIFFVDGGTDAMLRPDSF